MRSKGFWILSLFWLTGVCPATSQPVFLPYSGPTNAFPGTRIGFSVLAYDSETYHAPPLEYDLVAAPTNVTFWTAMGRLDELFAVMEWETPSRAEVGRTNVFIIRATDHGTPPVSSTLSVSFILVDPPPIEAIVVSNGVPALRFGNPIPIQPGVVFVQSYRVLWSADLALTNWSLLCAVSSGSPLITISDTNGVMPQRYYKLVPDGGWFYGFGAP